MSLLAMLGIAWGLFMTGTLITVVFVKTPGYAEATADVTGLQPSVISSVGYCTPTQNITYTAPPKKVAKRAKPKPKLIPVRLRRLSEVEERGFLVVNWPVRQEEYVKN